MSKLRFKLHGSRDDLGDAVTVRDFGDFVDALQDCFRQLERESDPKNDELLAAVRGAVANTNYACLEG